MSEYRITVEYRNAVESAWASLLWVFWSPLPPPLPPGGPFAVECMCTNLRRYHIVDGVDMLGRYLGALRLWGYKKNDLPDGFRIGSCCVLRSLIVSLDKMKDSKDWKSSGKDWTDWKDSKDWKSSGKDSTDWKDSKDWKSTKTTSSYSDGWRNS